VSLIAEFSVPSDELMMESTLAAAPEMRVEIERLATHSREWVMPFFWASGGDFDAFEDAAEADPTVRSLTTVQEMSDARLYNAHWSEEILELVDTVIDKNGTMLEASGSDGSWYLKLRFIERDQLAAFREHFETDGHGFELHRLSETTEPRVEEYNLTPKQRETLLAALESGYYDVPRGTTMTELAETIGVSSNSVSQRLRRAHAALVENTLTIKGYREQPRNLPDPEG
jgi:hypothetical protein